MNETFMRQISRLVVSNLVTILPNIVLFTSLSLSLSVALPVVVEAKDGPKANSQQGPNIDETVNIRGCEYALDSATPFYTLEASLFKAKQEIARILMEQPAPESLDVLKERAQPKWTGQKGPQALNELLPPNVSFAPTPSVNNEHFAMAKHLDPIQSGVFHREFTFNGEKTSSRLFVSSPSPGKLAETLKGRFRDLPAVVWHGQGGGTPNAESGNASTPAGFYLRAGMPTISETQPGHERGSRAPLLNGVDWSKYNLEAIQEMVHIETPVFVSGHSWGGQLAIQMNVMQAKGLFDNLGDDMKRNIERIRGFLSYSPPADPTFGLSKKEKAEFEEQGKSLEEVKIEIEQELESKFQQFAHLVADSDREFVENMVRNGKISMVAHFYLMLSQIGYTWERLSEEERKRWKPMIVVMGENDFLKAGLDKVYKKYGEKLPEGSRYIAIGPREDFSTIENNKGPQRVGHQTMDALIWVHKTTGKIEYEYAKVKDNLADYNEERELFYHALNFMSDQLQEPLKTIQPNAKENTPLGLLDNITKLWSNSFGFREYIKEKVVYLRRPNMKSKKALTSQAVALERFIKHINSIEKGYHLAKRDGPIKALKAHAELYNVRGGLNAARKEMDLDRSEERRQALAKTKGDWEIAEKRHHSTFKDEEFEHALAELMKRVKMGVDKKTNQESYLGWFNRNVDKLKAKIQPYLTYYDYSRAIETIGKNRKRSEKGQVIDLDESIRKQLEPFKFSSEQQLVSAFTDLEADLGGNSRKILELRRIYSQLPSDAKKVWNNASKRLNTAWEDYLAKKISFGEIVIPEGVRSSYKDVRWEHERLNMQGEELEQRMEVLDQYIKGYSKIEEEFYATVEAERDQGWLSADKPAGVDNFEEATAMLEEVEAKKDRTYIPKGESEAEARQLVEQMKAEEDLETAVSNELVIVNKQLEAKYKMRKRLNKQVSKLLAENDSVAIERALVKAEGAFVKFEKAYITAVEENNAHINAFREGGFQKDQLFDFSDSAKAAIAEFRVAFNNFTAATAEVEALKIEEALRGNLFSDSETILTHVDEAEASDANKGQQKKKKSGKVEPEDMDSPREVYTLLVGGVDYLNVPRTERVPLKGSVEFEIAKLERRLNTLQALASQSMNRSNNALMQYSQLFPDPENPEQGLYWTVHKMKIYDLLNLPLNELLAKMQDPKDGPIVTKVLDRAYHDWNTAWKQERRKYEDINAGGVGY